MRHVVTQFLSAAKQLTQLALPFPVCHSSLPASCVASVLRGLEDRAPGDRVTEEAQGSQEPAHKMQGEVLPVIQPEASHQGRTLRVENAGWKEEASPYCALAPAGVLPSGDICSGPLSREGETGCWVPYPALPQEKKLGPMVKACHPGYSGG